MNLQTDKRLKEIEVNLKKLSTNYIKLKALENLKNYQKVMSFP